MGGESRAASPACAPSVEIGAGLEQRVDHVGIDGPTEAPAGVIAAVDGERGPLDGHLEQDRALAGA